MRFLPVVAAILMLASPVWAQSSTAHKYNFSTSVCREKVSCPDDSENPMSASEFSSIANRCMTEDLGDPVPASGSFFDTEAGLDGNNCLTPIPGTLPPGSGHNLLHSCCVIKLPAGNCAFQCKIDSP